MRRHTHLLGIAWFASIVGCQPYESKTAELGESGIRPVLIPSETSNEAPPEYTPPPRPDAAELVVRMRERSERRARDVAPSAGTLRVEPIGETPEEVKRERAISRPSSRRPRTRAPSSGSSRSRASVQSSELDACVARHQRAKSDLDNYGKPAPEYVYFKTHMDRPPERVRCSRIRFYEKLGADRAQVYARALSTCRPLPASGPMYEAATARVTAIESECMNVARRAGISPGAARARLR